MDTAVTEGRQRTEAGNERPGRRWQPDPQGQATRLRRKGEQIHMATKIKDVKNRIMAIVKASEKPVECNQIMKAIGVAERANQWHPSISQREFETAIDQLVHGTDGEEGLLNTVGEVYIFEPRSRSRVKESAAEQDKGESRMNTKTKKSKKETSRRMHVGNVAVSGGYRQLIGDLSKNAAERAAVQRSLAKMDCLWGERKYISLMSSNETEVGNGIYPVISEKVVIEGRRYIGMSTDYSNPLRGFGCQKPFPHPWTDACQRGCDKHADPPTDSPSEVLAGNAQ